MCVCYNLCTCIPAWQGNVDVVNVLCMVKRKALEMRDKDGRAPLHWAALHGHTKVVVALLAADTDRKADLVTVAQDKRGWTPAHYAVEHVRQRTWAGLAGVTSQFTFMAHVLHAMLHVDLQQQTCVNVFCTCTSPSSPT